MEVSPSEDKNVLQKMNEEKMKTNYPAHLTAYKVISPNHCRPHILLLRKDSHILLRSRLGIITHVVLLTCSLFLSFSGDLSSPGIFNKTYRDTCTVSP